MAGGRRRRTDPKGRGIDRVGNADRVIIIRRSLWQSATISSLSCTARVLAIELLSMFNGTNNGSIFLSVRDATDRLGFTDYRPAIDAFQELQDAGLISLTFAGHFAIKAGEVSKAHAWRLNFVDGDGRPVGEAALPTIDLNTLPAKAQRRMAKRQKVLKRYLKDRTEGKFTVGESTTLDARSVGESLTVDPDSVGESTTPDAGNGGNASPTIVGESTTHISHHSPVVSATVIPLRTSGAGR